MVDENDVITYLQAFDLSEGLLPEFITSPWGTHLQQFQALEICPYFRKCL